VICSDFRVRESSADGGMARFSIDFDETAAAAVAPVAIPDAAALVAASAIAARRAAGNEFKAKFSPGSLMNSVAGSLRSATLRVNNIVSTVSMTTEQLASLKGRLDGLVAAANTLVNQPGNLLAELGALFESLPGSVALDVYAFDAGPRPPATTATRRREQENHDALRALVQRLAVVRASAAAPAEHHESYEAALRAREAITEKLDEQLEEAGDETYPALLQLRADLVKAVPGDDAALPRLLEYTPPRTVPSLVLAHRLYGDLLLEADLVTRNRIRHPGFVLGGRELEVLSRG
jgi:prophage DNA circulation protein